MRRRSLGKGMVWSRCWLASFSMSFLSWICRAIAANGFLSDAHSCAFGYLTHKSERIDLTESSMHCCAACMASEHRYEDFACSLPACNWFEALSIHPSMVLRWVSFINSQPSIHPFDLICDQRPNGCELSGAANLLHYIIAPRLRPPSELLGRSSSRVRKHFHLRVNRDAPEWHEDKL